MKVTIDSVTYTSGGAVLNGETKKGQKIMIDCLELFAGTLADLFQVNDLRDTIFRTCDIYYKDGTHWIKYLGQSIRLYKMKDGTFVL